jgi:hypothetical protein
MDTIEIVRIVGIIVALIPFVTFVTISVAMVKGVGNDDSTITALGMAGLTVFLIGVIMLVLAYLTNLIGQGMQQSASDALLLVIKIIGWIFTVPPPLIFLGVSMGLAYKVGKRDPVIRKLSIAALTMFLLGVLTAIITFLM